jgi:hypothetical protein
MDRDSEDNRLLANSGRARKRERERERERKLKLFEKGRFRHFASVHRATSYVGGFFNRYLFFHVSETLMENLQFGP